MSWMQGKTIKALYILSSVFVLTSLVASANCVYTSFMIGDQLPIKAISEIDFKDWTPYPLFRVFKKKACLASFSSSSGKLIISELLFDFL